jgi:hypothetical protein
MKITIDRSGTQFGPYTLEQVNTYAAAGRLFPSDMALYGGETRWVPLTTIEGVVIPPPATPASPPVSSTPTRATAVFRWLAVLPAAIICWVLTNLAVLALAKLSILAGIVLTLFSPVAFIAGGMMTAPGKRYATAVALTALYCAMQIIAALSAPQLAGSMNQASFSVAIAIAVCIGIRKGEFPKKY